MLPTIDISEPMQEAVPAFVVGSSLAAACSTTECCGCATDDLGADWLDRLELMIVIEDRIADVVITDEDVDQLEVVGDLIRHIENVDHERRRRSIVEATPLQ
jgi:acyl carrier protein